MQGFFSLDIMIEAVKMITRSTVADIADGMEGIGQAQYLGMSPSPESLKPKPLVWQRCT
jgi:hypothetical protein